LFSSVLEKKGSRITRSSKRKLQSQKETEELQENSPVARVTRMQRKKLKAESKMEFQTQNKSPGPKDKPKNCKGIQVRRSTKQKIEQSIQDEPIAEVNCRAPNEACN
jgi:hypothetical protein